MQDRPNTDAGAVAGPAGLVPMMLNHAAWVTQDVGATADFYTRVLGMELASTLYDERVPSTGDSFPYFHIFFRMADGSTLAFFESPGLPPRPPPSHPAYAVFDHIALQARDRAELLRWRQWLLSNHVEVLGPIDHKGQILSIYFHDPNGLRLEITTPLDPQWNRHTAQACEDLRLWLQAKEHARLENRDISEALTAWIRERRRELAGSDPPVA